MKKRHIIVGALACLVALGLGGEIAAREAINSRLPDTYHARFTGPSALVAAATDSTRITLTVGPERLADALTAQLGRKAAERAQVVMAEGAVGLETTIRSRPLIAWFALDVDGDQLIATPVSVDIAGVQLGPDLLFGSEPIAVPHPLDKQCGIPINDVAVHPEGVDLTITVARADAACLKQTENP